MNNMNDNRSYSGLVQKYIGTAYDKVATVADNLSGLLDIQALIDSGVYDELIALGPDIRFAAVMINFKGLWAVDVPYAVGDSVKYNDTLWFSNKANINEIPSINSIAWSALPTEGVVSIDSFLDINSKGTNLNLIIAKGLRKANDDGGGIWQWNALKNKSEANLGVFLDPDVSLTLADQGTGVGVGCWERILINNYTPEMWGAPSNGFDSDSSAVQAAVDYIQGSVFKNELTFNAGKKYIFNSQVVVDGKHDITFSSTHGGLGKNNLNTSINSGYLGIGPSLGAHDYIFYVTAHNPTQRYKAANVTFQHLSFADDSNISNDASASQQGHAVGGAIHIDVSDEAEIKNCRFMYIKGTAIRAARIIMGLITECSVRSCGNGAAAPAIWFSATSDPKDIVQALTLSDCKIESNYGVYIKADTLATSKITGCSFEANSIDAIDHTSHAFLTMGSVAKRNIVSNNSFNRCGVTIIDCSAKECLFIGNTFAGNNPASPVVNLSALFCKFTSNNVKAGPAQIGIFLRVAEKMCSITNNSFHYSGSLHVTLGGNDVSILNNQFNLPYTEEPAVIDVRANSALISNNHIEEVKSGVDCINAYREASIVNNTIQMFHNNGIVAENNAIISGNNLRSDALNSVGIKVIGNNGLVTDNSLMRIIGTKILPFDNKTSIHNNIGYITKESGTAKIHVGKQEVKIKHGLVMDAGTRLVVLLTKINQASASLVVTTEENGYFIVRQNTPVVGVSSRFYWEVKRANNSN